LKYYNFFIESFADGLKLLGFKGDFWTLNIILPVGISFYTFHGLSYVIDIYKEKIKPEQRIFFLKSSKKEHSIIKWLKWGTTNIDRILQENCDR
jgi:hypothetical protein